MNVYKIAVVLIVENIPPDMFVKLLPGKDLVAVQDQILKQVIFLFCQIDLVSVAD